MLDILPHLFCIEAGEFWGLKIDREGEGRGVEDTVKAAPEPEVIQVQVGCSLTIQ
jgi:hypothetical protein